MLPALIADLAIQASEMSHKVGESRTMMQIFASLVQEECATAIENEARQIGGLAERTHAENTRIHAAIQYAQLVRSL